MRQYRELLSRASLLEGTICPPKDLSISLTLTTCAEPRTALRRRSEHSRPAETLLHRHLNEERSDLVHHDEHDERPKSESIVAALVENGTLEPVADRDEDARLWMNCELCLFIENRLHCSVDPESLTRDQFATWSRQALAAGDHLQDPRRPTYRVAFWIVDRGVRVGTLALPQAPYHLFQPVESLYVFPVQRSRGVAYRALRAVNHASRVAGFSGIRIGTFWTWQAAVRRYLLRYGMWAWSFKRSLEFVWATHLPKHTITIDESTARFAIEQDACTCDQIVASRDGDLLVWNELTDNVLFEARSTFAVALAIHGWPLLGAGGVVNWGDIGGPDVLAYKIALFEFLDRQDGFDVRAPRIPGLPYQAIERRFAE